MRTSEQIERSRAKSRSWYKRNKEKQKAKMKARYWLDPQQYKERERARYRARGKNVNVRSAMIRRLRNKYKLTIEQYESMVIASNGRCAICARMMQDVGRGVICIDHDHMTGVVRGLLCDDCNVGLGRFKDNIDSLKAAIDYLFHSPE